MGDEKSSGVVIRRRQPSVSEPPLPPPMPDAGLSALRRWLDEIRLDRNMYVADLRNRLAEFAFTLREIGFTRKVSYREIHRPSRAKGKTEPKSTFTFLTWTGDVIMLNKTPSNEMTATQLVWVANNLDKLLAEIEGSEKAELWKLHRAVRTVEDFLEYLRGSTPAQEPPPEPASNE